MSLRTSSMVCPSIFVRSIRSSAIRCMAVSGGMGRIALLAPCPGQFAQTGKICLGLRQVACRDGSERNPGAGRVGECKPGEHVDGKNFRVRPFNGPTCASSRRKVALYGSPFVKRMGVAPQPCDRYALVHVRLSICFILVDSGSDRADRPCRPDLQPRITAR